MSLPMPTTSSTPTLSTQQLQQLDAPLIALTQRCNGDLRLVLHSFFSFLNRRTDFYCLHNQQDIDQGLKASMGFKEGDSEKLLLAAYRQFPLRRMPPTSQLTKGRGDAKNSVAAHSTTKVSGKDPAQAIPSPHSETEVANDVDVIVDADVDVDVDAVSKAAGTEQSEGKSKDAGASEHDSKEESQPKSNDILRYTEDGNQIPVGNGGSAKDYKWTQTLQEITIAMPLPSNPDTRAKDLNVQIKYSTIDIHHKLLDKKLFKGDLLDKVRVDESTWSIESNLILVTLEKIDKRWWNRVLKDDESDIIDISLVDKTHKISDYDEATQGMVRKILFDQRQERLGLPSSDEILGEEVEEKTGLEAIRDCHGKRVDVSDLPAGVQFIDKHNFPGGARKR